MASNSFRRIALAQGLLRPPADPTPPDQEPQAARQPETRHDAAEERRAQA
ncbi:MAG: hypothetical protein M0Z28_08735 [Rhodospirillales bacterium]|nr:hypothetical protein [Rhodospirillales bacterium]